MPHLKVNVNGKRYTISGITRGTCNKQILCALAKVDAELQTSTSLTEKLNQRKDSTDSASEDQKERPRQARKSRKKSKREEKCKTCKEAEGIARSGKKNASRKIRSTKRVAELTNSKGIQTSNGMLETLGKVAESQQNCLSTEQKEVQELKTSLQAHQELNGKDVEVDAVTTENVERKCVEDQAKDTDHDTGISELHSDSSFDTNQVLHNKEKVATTECSALSCSNRESQITVKCASTNTDPIQPADNTDVRMRKISSIDDFIVAELLGSETDAENDEECTCNCVYVDSDSEELREQIKKMRGELKLTEAKLAEQNQKVESLNVLIHTDQRNAKQRFNDVMLNDDVSNYVSDDVTKHVDELKQSIKLSNELYDYQKIETQANVLELERVESQIRRKRWHMESLLKELRSVRNNLSTRGGPRGTVHNRNEGTLV